MPRLAREVAAEREMPRFMMDPQAMHPPQPEPQQPEEPQPMMPMMPMHRIHPMVMMMLMRGGMPIIPPHMMQPRIAQMHPLMFTPQQQPQMIQQPMMPPQVNLDGFSKFVKNGFTTTTTRYQELQTGHS
ncbi:unnamed protein product [Gongylonema pulchrum]|uniref:DUF4587 domain-containing protein n=1 Tax=Gongylonema pulchrum TaxID=637853 RepID=A0A183DMQ7_9BILA|nr:unnamed protein product [Gongylonema pulchrum]